MFVLKLRLFNLRGFGIVSAIEIAELLGLNVPPLTRNDDFEPQREHVEEGSRKAKRSWD
jgi:hypothetical protein